MCLVFLWMLETANCPGFLSETGEVRAGKKGPKTTWGLRLGLKYAKRKEQTFLQHFACPRVVVKGLWVRRIFFFFSTNWDRRTTPVPDSSLQWWRHASALLHTKSITNKGHRGHIWHNRGHFLDPAVHSGCLTVQSLVHSGCTLQPSRQPTPDPSVRNKPLLLLSTANEDKGEQRSQRLDCLSSLTLYLPSENFFYLQKLRSADDPSSHDRVGAQLPTCGSILHVRTHEAHYWGRQ